MYLSITYSPEEVAHPLSIPQQSQQIFYALVTRILIHSRMFVDGLVVDPQGGRSRPVDPRLRQRNLTQRRPVGLGDDVPMDTTTTRGCANVYLDVVITASGFRHVMLGYNIGVELFGKPLLSVRVRPIRMKKKEQPLPSEGVHPPSESAILISGA